MRELDLQTWPRRAVYELFSGCDWPFYQISFPLDVTNLRAYTKKEGLSFYYTLAWLLTKGMEQQEAFLIRIRRGKLFVMDELLPSCTDLRPGAEVFHFVTLPAGDDPADFCSGCDFLSICQRNFQCRVFHIFHNISLCIYSKITGFRINGHMYIVRFAKMVLASLDQRLFNCLQQCILADIFFLFQDIQRLH